MICKNCGSEVPENQKFCGNCGAKVEVSNSNGGEFTDNAYNVKLAKANNAVELFLSKEVHSLIEYQQISNLFGEVENVGAQNSQTYVSELEFYIKANMLNDLIVANNAELFEKTYDNIIKLALLNAKSEDEKEKIKTKFNKEKILSEFKTKLNVKLEERKKRNKPFKIAVISVVAIIVVMIGISVFLDSRSSTSSNNTTTSGISNTPQTPEQLYNSTKYQNTKYGEQVVSGYCSQYGSFSGIGKITSFTSSEFLEKDGQGRFAFEVSFRYNPTNRNGDTMLDRESSKKVYAIYIVNPDDPDGVYVGASNVKFYGTWDKIKAEDDVCFGDWGAPITAKFE